MEWTAYNAGLTLGGVPAGWVWEEGSTDGGGNWVNPSMPGVSLSQYQQSQVDPLKQLSYDEMIQQGIDIRGVLPAGYVPEDERLAAEASAKFIASQTLPPENYNYIVPQIGVVTPGANFQGLSVPIAAPIGAPGEAITMDDIMIAIKIGYMLGVKETESKLPPSMTGVF